MSKSNSRFKALVTLAVIASVAALAMVLDRDTLTAEEMYGLLGILAIVTFAFFILGLIISHLRYFRGAVQQKAQAVHTKVINRIGDYNAHIALVRSRLEGIAEFFDGVDIAPLREALRLIEDKANRVTIGFGNFQDPENDPDRVGLTAAEYFDMEERFAVLARELRCLNVALLKLDVKVTAMNDTVNVTRLSLVAQEGSSEATTAGIKEVKLVDFKNDEVIKDALTRGMAFCTNSECAAEAEARGNTEAEFVTTFIIMS